MSISLKGCKFEHNELSIRIETFNDECAIVKEAQDANLLSQESKQTPRAKMILFQYLKLNLQP